MERLSNSSIWASIDDEMLPLVDSVNRVPGLTSGVSCMGHGQTFPYLYLTLDRSDDEAIQGIALVQAEAKKIGWLVSICVEGLIDDCKIGMVLTPLAVVRSPLFKGSYIKVPVQGDYSEEQAAEEVLRLSKGLLAGVKKIRCTLKRPLMKVPWIE